MRTRKLKGPDVKKRDVPPTERKIIEPLIEEMEKTWSAVTPPLSELARVAIYGHSFMSLRKFSEFFPMVLGQKKLVDLGAGAPDAMMHFALRSGVSEYVAVDRYWNYSKKVPPFANVSYVNDDMLRFLAEQPDGSANIAMVAIDDIVLSSLDPISESLYVGMLLAEIKRVIPQGGIAFGMNSALLCGLKEMGFTDVRKISGHLIPDNYDDGGIFQKM